MKQKLLILLIITLLTGFVSAEVFRLGGVGAAELMENPLGEETPKELEGEVAVIPGIYWEVLLGHLGFGMTYLADFTPVETAASGTEYDWYLDWIGTWDFRYHIFGGFGIDPFLELGIGNAGRVRLSEDDYSNDQATPLLMSLFVQAGGGAAIRLGNMHLGGKVLYRISNDPIPATQYELYPLKDFQLSFFGGFSF